MNLSIHTEEENNRLFARKFWSKFQHIRVLKIGTNSTELETHRIISRFCSILTEYFSSNRHLQSLTLTGHMTRLIPGILSNIISNGKTVRVDSDLTDLTFVLGDRNPRISFLLTNLVSLTLVFTRTDSVVCQDFLNELPHSSPQLTDLTLQVLYFFRVSFLSKNKK